MYLSPYFLFIICYLMVNSSFDVIIYITWKMAIKEKFHNYTIKLIYLFSNKDIWNSFYCLWLSCLVLILNLCLKNIWYVPVHLQCIPNLVITKPELYKSAFTFVKIFVQNYMMLFSNVFQTRSVIDGRTDLICKFSWNSGPHRVDQFIQLNQDQRSSN